MNGISRCLPKSQNQLTREWDCLAVERHREIVSGEDLSFTHVIAPTALQLLHGADLTTVVDIGSGTGDFTVRLAMLANTVLAVEPSGRSISIAETVCKDRPNVKFIPSTLEEAVGQVETESATAAVAVMSLMAAPNLREMATALARLLRRNAPVVAVLTHPCFWPRYWGYESAEWFDYSSELFIEAPFVISRHRTSFTTTHIHRPMSRYFTVLAQAGFRLDSTVEPIPSLEVQALYPVPWSYPRFLAFRWERM